MKIEKMSLHSYRYFKNYNRKRTSGKKSQIGENVQ